MTAYDFLLCERELKKIHGEWGFWCIPGLLRWDVYNIGGNQPVTFRELPIQPGNLDFSRKA